MAETPLKRQREEAQTEEVDENKRHKSYNHILSLLEEEEEEPHQDLSSLITTLQQELSSEFNPENPTAETTTTVDDYACSSSGSSSSSSFLKELDEEDDREREIRHLLEASDDELGIPTNTGAVSGGEDNGDEGFVNGADSAVHGVDCVDGFALCDGLWEFEDVNANYYTMFQSELFM